MPFPIEMRIPRWIAALSLAVSGSVDAQTPAWTPLDSSVTAFVGVNVIPMDRDTVLADHTVLVQHGRITALGPRVEVPVPLGVRRIDGAGKWLMPGLADAHVHLGYLMNGTHNPALLRLFVAEGVTTVVNLLGLPEHIDLRSKIASGEVLGPMLATSGFYVGEPFTKAGTPIDSAVRQQRSAGFDMVKLHGPIDSASYRNLLAAGRRENIPIVGHLPRNLGLRAALDGGQSMIAHAEEYLYGWFFFGRAPSSREHIMALVDSAAALTAKAGTWVTPTLAVFGGIAPQIANLDSMLKVPEMRRIPDVLKWEWVPERNRYKSMPPAMIESFQNQHMLLRRLTLALHKAGVPLLMGTDAMATAAVLPGISAHQELRELVAAGLTPYEALRTATVNVARFLGQPNEYGAIAPGRRADLVLVDANPLLAIESTSRIAGVMLRGRWLDRFALDTLRKGTQP